METVILPPWRAAQESAHQLSEGELTDVDEDVIPTTMVMSQGM